MLEKLNQNDHVLSQGQFLSNEVQYNLIHRIIESVSSTCLKTANGQMIYAQSIGHNGWLWISRNVTVDQKENMIRELVEYLKDHTLPGISGEPHTVENFAKEY